MDTQRVSLAIKSQIGELHRRRHPSKGVVVEFSNFHDDVERRTQLFRRLTRHRNMMPDIMRRQSRLQKNRFRWIHINRMVRIVGCSVVALTIRWQDDVPVGFNLSSKAGTISLDAKDPGASQILKDLWVETVDGIVVYHAESLLSENLATMGLRLPDFKHTVDTAQVAGLMIPMGANMPKSHELGSMLNVERGDYENQGEFLLALFDVMVDKEDLFG